jgi:hypothetical protein
LSGYIEAWNFSKGLLSIATALSTADRAAQLYLEEANAAVFHAEMRRKFERRLSFRIHLSRLMIAIPSSVQAVIRISGSVWRRSPEALFKVPAVSSSQDKIVTIL